MVRCSRCGADNPDNLTFCRDCGNRLKAQEAHPGWAAPAVGPAAPGAYAAQAQPGVGGSAAPARPAAPDFDFSPRAGGGDAALPCGRCGTVNPPTNRFCLSCGTPLTAQAPPPAQPAAAMQARPMVVPVAPAAAPAQRPVCERCRGVNAPGTQYCQFCGNRLLAGPAPAAAAPPQYAAQAPAHYAAQAAPPAAPAQLAYGVPPAPAGAPVAPRQAPVAAGRPRARLVVITQDGTPGRDYELSEDQVDIGREEGSILLQNDPYVSPRHARFRLQNGRFFVRDLSSLNGVYLRIRGPEKLQHGDLVLIGLEVLRFEFVTDAEKNLGPAVERGTQLFGSPATTRHARLCQRTVEGITRDIYSLTRDETVIGRESGDVVFTSDPFMSRQHAAINRNPTDKSFSIRDLGSSNGTYVAIRGEAALQPGDHVRIGQHLFRLEVDSQQRH